MNVYQHEYNNALSVDVSEINWKGKKTVDIYSMLNNYNVIIIGTKTISSNG